MLNNPQHAMNKVMQNGFDSPLLVLKENEFRNDPLLQFTRRIKNQTIAVHSSARPERRSRRPSWRRSAFAGACVIKFRGRTHSFEAFAAASRFSSRTTTFHGTRQHRLPPALQPRQFPQLAVPLSWQNHQKV